MISKPKEAAKAQARHQEEAIKKMNLFISSKINEHVTRYIEDEDETYSINVSMREHSVDFGYFESELKEVLDKELTTSGWKLLSMEPKKTGEVVFQIKAEVSIEELDQARDEERALFLEEARRKKVLNGNQKHRQ